MSTRKRHLLVLWQQKLVFGTTCSFVLPSLLRLRAVAGHWPSCGWEARCSVWRCGCGLVPYPCWLQFRPRSLRATLLRSCPPPHRLPSAGVQRRKHSPERTETLPDPSKAYYGHPFPRFSCAAGRTGIGRSPRGRRAFVVEAMCTRPGSRDLLSEPMENTWSSRILIPLLQAESSTTTIHR